MWHDVVGRVVDENDNLVGTIMAVDAMVLQILLLSV